MIRKNPISKNEPFECLVCKTKVIPHTSGSCRNHCPKCLHSRHVDKYTPGDRKEDCKGIMKPINIEFSNKKGEVLIFECTKCGKVSKNKVAPDDSRKKLEELASENMKQ